MNQKSLAYLLIAILVLYFFVGVGADLLTHKNKKIYPFFSWFLFSKAPSRETVDYTILIHKAGDEVFSPAVPFEKVENLYNKRYPTTYYNQKIGRIAQMIKSDPGQAEIEKIRRELESQFLITPVTYEISKITYDPVERWEKGAVISSTTIQIYETNQ